VCLTDPSYNLESRRSFLVFLAFLLLQYIHCRIISQPLRIISNMPPRQYFRIPLITQASHVTVPIMANLPNIFSIFGLRSPSKIEISDDEDSVFGTDASEKRIFKNKKAPKPIQDSPLLVESEDDEDEDDDDIAEDELVYNSIRNSITDGS